MAQAQDFSIRAFFLDKNFSYCDSIQASYYGYSLNDSTGKPKASPLGYLGKTYLIRYKATEDSAVKQKRQLLNGKITYSGINDTTHTLFYEIYEKGFLKVYSEVYYSPRFGVRNASTVYFDSLYQKQPFSFLVYTTQDNTLLHKEYRETEEKVPRVYFVPHRDFRYLNRLCIGYYGTAGNGLKEGESPREFGELGYSRKFVHGWYCDSTKRYYDRNRFLYKAVNASFLLSPGNTGMLTGQRATFSYVALVYRLEAGLVNYTNFNKWDPRLTFGAGMSILHWVNIQFNWSVPLTNHTFDDVGRISLGIFIN